VTIESSPVYLDTSALAKLYLPEPGSDALESALLGRRDLLVSDLAATEFTSAVGRRLREGDLSARDARRIYTRLRGDFARGEYQRLELTGAIHRDAERLLMSLGRTIVLRALDALHLALAAGSAAGAFVSFDRKQLAAARALGTFELPA
jgi:predicted nucleic acid-binding protein